MHTLVKGLEKIAASADIPMLVAGDFNSVPGSAAHSLLVKHSVEAGHPVRATTAPCCLLFRQTQPQTERNICHQSSAEVAAQLRHGNTRGA